MSVTRVCGLSLSDRPSSELGLPIVNVPGRMYAICRSRSGTVQALPPCGFGSFFAPADVSGLAAANSSGDIAPPFGRKR